MKQYKAIKTHIGKHLKNHKIVHTFGIIIFLIIFFDKLFILIIFTLIIQLKKIMSFLKNKIITFLPILR
jgi:hypothetical protein